MKWVTVRLKKALGIITQDKPEDKGKFFMGLRGGFLRSGIYILAISPPGGGIFVQNEKQGRI